MVKTIFTVIVFFVCLNLKLILLQFDTEFNPTNLGNWEVPKWYPDKPCIRKGCTKIISNDQGHILPGLKKTSSPWGNYIGTWQLPKRITREIGG